MAAFLYRMAGSPQVKTSAGFIDVSSVNPFRATINWMASQNISTGWADGTYRPYDSVTREAMAAFIYRFTYRG